MNYSPCTFNHYLHCRHHRLFAQEPHHPEMGDDCLTHGREFVIGDVELLAGLLHNIAQGRVMDMTNPWE